MAHEEIQNGMYLAFEVVIGMKTPSLATLEPYKQVELAIYTNPLNEAMYLKSNKIHHMCWKDENFTTIKLHEQ